MSQRLNIGRTRFADLWRTTGGRVLVLLVAIVILVNVGAALVIAFGDFSDYPDAVWWAITHALDPGRLSDDAAWDERVIGLALVVIGLVVLLGIFLAIITEGVQRALRHLDDTPGHLPEGSHVVVCGWSRALPATLDVLGRSVAAHPAVADGAARSVVVVAPRSLRDERAALDAELRRHRRTVHAHVVFGDSSDPAVLDVVRARAAAVVLVLPDDLEAQDPSAVDLATIARALGLARYLDDAGPRPTVLVQIGRERSLAAAELLPSDFVPLVTDRMTTGTLKLALTSPAWSRALLGDLWDPAAASLRTVEGRALTGSRFAEVAGHVADALPLGVRHPDGAFDTRPATVLESGDRLVVLDAPGMAVPETAGFTARPSTEGVAEIRVLVVGWNHRVPTLVADLAATSGVRYVVTSLSEIDEEPRRAQIADSVISATGCSFVTGRLDDDDALRAVVDEADPAGVVVTSTLVHPVRDPAIDLAAADAQAVLTVLALQRVITRAECPTLLDLFLPTNAAVTMLAGRLGVVATADLAASTVASVALDPDLATAMMTIFADDRNPPRVEPFSPDDDRAHEFGETYRALLDTGRVAVGIVGGDGEPVLSPDSATPIAPGTQMLVLDTTASNGGSSGAR